MYSHLHLIPCEIFLFHFVLVFMVVCRFYFIKVQTVLFVTFVYIQYDHGVFIIINIKIMTYKWSNCVHDQLLALH